jgi:hypothetical protein
MEPISNEPINEDEYSSDEEYDDVEEEQGMARGKATQPQQQQPPQPRGGNPYGSTVIRQHKTQGLKKERIKRRGLFALNMTRNYGIKSGWGEQEGFRELIQNLYSPLKLSAFCGEC